MNKPQGLANLRVPPHSLESEQAVLGALMLRPAAIHEIVDLLTPDMFYAKKHSIIFKTILELSMKNEPIDVLSLANSLKEKKDLAGIGGNTYLNELMSNVPSTVNIRHYADIVYKKFILRSLIDASESIATLSYEENELPAAEILDAAEKSIFRISSTMNTKNAFVSIKQSLMDTVEQIEHLREHKDEIRGRHTTTFVSTDADLHTAFRSAQQLCRHVSIEKCLLGPVCRATIIQGNLAGFFAAYPPTVVGDSVSTIHQLIEAWNASVPDRVQPITLTPEHSAFMRRRGVSEDTVLENGVSMTLSHRTGRLFGGTTRELLSSVHPKLRAYAENAARELDVPVVGFDLIIADPEQDPDTQEWGIIEANSLPFIDLHYLPLYGRPSNPAAQVWDMWTHQ
jgi:hypothetical protein